MSSRVRKSISVGIVLIFFGILFLLDNLNISIGDWIILGVGVAFLVSYFMRRKTPLLVIGLILSFLGALIFLNSLNVLTSTQGWGVFFVTLGIGFLIVYFITKKISTIFPGFILLAIGADICLFTIIELYNTWPIVFMSLSLAFLLIFILTFRKIGYIPLVFSIILFIIGLLCFMSIRGFIDREMWYSFTTFWERFWPLILVALGILVIFKASRKQK